MKNILLMAGLLALSAGSYEQDSWRVLINKKLILSSQVSDEAKNTRLIRSADWKNPGYLQIDYKEKVPSRWLHTLQLDDEKGVTIISRDSVWSLRLPLSSLRRSFAGKKQIKIYMILNPPDPMMAAPSRMIHLATLKLP